MMNLTRRKFLNTVVLSASAIAVTNLVGCGSDSSGSGECSFSSDIFKHSIMSGDPRENSLILWTRVNDACALTDNLDVSLIVEVATDNAFTNLIISESVDVLAEYDHNIKLRLTGLTADTRYYYRFVYAKDGTNYSSNTGRTRTAPDASSERKVRFAYVSCQDFIGRYYNNYLNLLTPEMLNGGDDADDDGLDFVVHLGDYIYETTGDPDFQEAAGDRVVAFSDLDGAIKLGTADKPYYAAQSLSNYRELYQTYRTDALLQKVQENFPMIVTWDDHEFSDDSWQDTTTYLNGVPGETNQLTRKRNSERAYFESMPIDHEYAFDAAATDVVGSGTEQQLAMGVSDEQLFPNTKIYRDFTFGSKVHLLMSDFRSHRPDHLIAEDAFPGVMAMTEDNVKATLTATTASQAVADATFDAIKSSLHSYINIDNAEYALQKTLIKLAAKESYKASAISQGKALSEVEVNVLVEKQVKGLQSVTFINLVLAQGYDTFSGFGILPAGTSSAADIQITAPVDASVGISYFLLGKQSFFGEIGARYFVVKSSFDLYAAYKLLVSGETKSPYGTVQQAWLESTLTQSATDAAIATATGTGDFQSWRILGSSVSFSPLVLDLRPQAAGRAEITSANVSEVTGITDATTLATIAGGLEQTIEGLSTDPTSSLSLLGNQFYLNVDHWDGFPIYKKGLIDNLFSPTGTISIAGDVHSSYIGRHPANANGNRSFDLTTSSISSGTFGQFMNGALGGIVDGLKAAGVEITDQLQGGLDLLQANWSVLVQTASPIDEESTGLKRARLNEHSLVTVVADATNIDFTYHAIADSGDLVTKSYYDDVDTFLGNVNQTTYRIENNDISEIA
ncbi:MAG: alkaline phosphatase D family protein [Bermanella sp.]